MLPLLNEEKGWKMHEQEKVLYLIKQGCHVEIVNPYAKTFYEKYKVYSKEKWSELKKVNVIDHGNFVEISPWQIFLLPYNVFIPASVLMVQEATFTQ